MYDPTKSNGDTQAFWYSQLTADDEAKLAGDGPLSALRLNVDVAIIGAGIAGLSVAYHLCKAGKNVVVVDKGLIGSGETGRTTAHVSNALDDHYTELEKSLGEVGAQLAAASHSAAITDIERIVHAEGIACAWQRIPGYLESVAKDEALAHHELERECEAAKRAGLAVELVRDPSCPWTRGWHVRFEQQAQFQPLAYLLGLAAAIKRMGGHIYTRSRVTSIDDWGTPVIVKLGDEHQLSARDVVVATNTPIVDRFAMHTKQASYRSYALAIRLERPMPAALLWDTGDPYHYVRSAGDDVLLVGGEDHKVGQAGDSAEAWSRLEAWSRARFELAEVRARWSGQIQEPYDGMAFIGKNPGLSRHVFIATGDSGNGITHGALAGLLIRDLIVEPHSLPDWAGLYDPSRKPHNRAIRQFLRENANVAVHFTQLLVPASLGHPVVPPGEGRVINRGLHHVALYVDQDGRSHECSAICPHLGCVVQWNGLERSWDCPCHGSRFDPYGQVLTGPAHTDLKSLTHHTKESTETMQDKLLRHLSHELWQTEVSASQHCRREAERLGDTPPARVLRKAGEHADTVLAALPQQAIDRPLAASAVGMLVGKFFSEARDTVADKLLTSERSYRGTLLGLRHGVDLVKLMRDAADSAGNVELTHFLDEWLWRRKPLVDAVAEELRWFASRPEIALRQARGLLTRRNGGVKSAAHS